MLEHTGTREIWTERLLLRRFREGDEVQMYRNYTSDPEVTKYLTWNPHKSQDVTRNYLSIILPEYESPDTYRWAIELKGEVIGAIDAVDMDTENENCEIGYCMGKAWWGKGIMTEALKAVIDFMFTVPGFYCVHARHDEQNPASGRVMAKAGMTYEGMLRARRKKEGAYYGLCHYSITRSEYPEK
jgi:ribosomal-protein-alanine N-acetyltransferase